MTTFDGQGFVAREDLLRPDLARVIHAAGTATIADRFGATAASPHRRATDESPSGGRA